MSGANSKSENPTAARKSFKRLAVLVGLLPVVCVELLLRISGIGADRFDPYAEFGGRAPVFVREGEVYRTARAREPFLAPQSFAAEKPAGAYRVFCFGGSTVHGRPYSVETAFPKWMEIELAARLPGRAIEVVNVGGISYASFRIVPMVREAMRHQPDAIVLATGHNEFLEDRTYHQAKDRGGALRLADRLRVVSVGRQWLRQRRESSEADPKFKTRLDEVNGYASYHRDPVWRERVLTQFQGSVNEIARLCEAHSVPLILVQLGSNLRDSPPFKSEHRADLSPEDERAWQALFERGGQLDATDPAGALEAYDQAAELDDQFALLCYRQAKAMDRAGRVEGLLAAYKRAKEEDVCPLRMLEAQYGMIERAARAWDAILVDAATELRRRSPESVPGFDWYLDHVHPTIGGHQLIARLILERMAEGGLFKWGRDWSEAERASAYAAHFDRLGNRYLRDGARRLEWLDGWARRAKLADELTPRDWADHLRLGMRRLDFGAQEDARAAFEKALELNPAASRERLEAHVLRLREQGRAQASQWLRRWLADQG